jgi:hypothetical protein
MNVNCQAREWNYPRSEGEIYKPGDLLRVYLWNQPDNHDRDHAWHITQLSGTKDYGKTNVTNE